jgi:hypothetical protein
MILVTCRKSFVLYSKKYMPNMEIDGKTRQKNTENQRYMTIRSKSPGLSDTEEETIK